MEAWHEADRPASRPPLRHSLSLGKMLSGISWCTCASIAPICILPSGKAGGESLLRPPSERLRKSAPPPIRLASRPIHSFLALSPRYTATDGTNRRLEIPSQRLTIQTTHSCSDLFDQARISEVIQDSDFRTEIALRKNTCSSAVPLCVRRRSGHFASPHHLHIDRQNT